MAQPGYDFFATGGPTGAPEGSAAPEPATSRFGGPVLPTEPDPSAPVVAAAPPAHGVAPGSAPAAPAVLAPAHPGYNPGSVNQFGTPLDLPAVPTGPFAAPGLGAAPIAQPGLVSTWGENAGTTALEPAQPVSRFGGPVIDDGSYGTPSYAGPAAAHRAHATEPARPGTVLAAGIIGIVEGVIVLVLGGLALIGYLALKGQMSALESELASTPGFTGSGFDGLADGISAMILVGALLLLAMGSLFLVAGAATVRGRRWGAWTLLVVSVLGVLQGLYQLVTDGAGGGLLGLGVSGAVVVLLMLGDSQRWLRRA